MRAADVASCSRREATLEALLVARGHAPHPNSNPKTLKTAGCARAQLTSPVQWEATLEALLARGLERSYELGPNKVIAGTMKRTDKAHPVTNIQV